jgi:hypothetical protein
MRVSENRRVTFLLFAHASRVRGTAEEEEEYADIDVSEVVDLTHQSPTPQKGNAAKKRR